jgi:hypothetical protein
MEFVKIFLLLYLVLLASRIPNFSMNMAAKKEGLSMDTAQNRMQKAGESRKREENEDTMDGQEVQDEQDMATQKATEIREEHATELHALQITGTDHIIQKTAQAPRLTNNESNPSVMTQHQSGELKKWYVTVDASGEAIVAPGPICSLSNSYAQEQPTQVRHRLQPA